MMMIRCKKIHQFKSTLKEYPSGQKFKTQDQENTNLQYKNLSTDRNYYREGEGEKNKEDDDIEELYTTQYPKDYNFKLNDEEKILKIFDNLPNGSDATKNEIAKKIEYEIDLYINNSKTIILDVLLTFEKLLYKHKNEIKFENLYNYTKDLNSYEKYLKYYKIKLSKIIRENQIINKNIFKIYKQAYEKEISYFKNEFIDLYKPQNVDDELMVYYFIFSSRKYLLNNKSNRNNVINLILITQFLEITDQNLSKITNKKTHKKVLKLFTKTNEKFGFSTNQLFFRILIAADQNLKIEKKTINTQNQTTTNQKYHEGDV